jgi:hypothetical protein
MVVCKARHRLLFLVVLTLFPCRLVAYGGWRLVSLTVYALVFGGGRSGQMEGRQAGHTGMVTFGSMGFGNLDAPCL